MRSEKVYVSNDLPDLYVICTLRFHHTMEIIYTF